jgi:hypothetical protein
MSTRQVTDCDRCGNENIKESFRLEVPTETGGPHGPEPTRKRLDLDTKCLGTVLQEFLDKMTTQEGTEFLSKVQKTGRSKAAEAKK